MPYLIETSIQQVLHGWAFHTGAIAPTLVWVVTTTRIFGSSSSRTFGLYDFLGLGQLLS